MTYCVPISCHSLLDPATAELRDFSTTIASPERQIRALDCPGIPLHIAVEIKTSFPDLLATLRATKPDLVLFDGFTLAGMYAAAALQIPAIRCETSHLPLPENNFYFDLEQNLSCGRLSSPESRAQFVAEMRPFWREHGFAETEFLSLIAAAEDQLTLVFMHPALQHGSGRARSNVHYVGASIDSSRANPDEAVPALKSAGSLVVVSLGTVFNYEPAFYLMCLEAFRDLPIQVVMSVGAVIDTGLFEDVPPNCTVARQIPQLQLLRQADLLIAHGGMGSVSESLASGVPLLIVPHFPEQMLTAIKIEQLQLGRMLARGDVSINRLRRCASELLADGRMREHVKQFAPSFKTLGGFQRAADLVEAQLHR